MPDAAVHEVRAQPSLPFMTRRPRLVIVSLSLVLSALVGLMLARRPDQEAFGIARVGGSFHLVDQAGHVFDDAQLKGHGFLVLFGCTRCGDPTLAALQTLVAATRQAQGKHLGLQSVFIALDTENDAAVRLASFMSAFTPPIVGLTGSQSELARVSKAYHVHASTGVDGLIQNVTTTIYLMGSHGEFLLALEPEAGAAELVRSVETLL